MKNWDFVPFQHLGSVYTWVQLGSVEAWVQLRLGSVEAGFSWGWVQLKPGSVEVGFSWSLGSVVAWVQLKTHPICTIHEDMDSEIHGGSFILKCLCSLQHFLVDATLLHKRQKLRMSLLEYTGGRTRAGKWGRHTNEILYSACSSQY